MKCPFNKQTLTQAHVWTWAGSGEIPDGTPCDCGRVYYGKEKNNGSSSDINHYKKAEE